MANNDLTAKIRIDGDAKSAQEAIAATEKGMERMSGTAQRTKGSTDQLNASFNKLGIRSAGQIQADILAVNQALADLARRANVTGEDFDRAFAAGQQQIAKLNAELTGLPVEKAAQGIGGLTGAFSSLQGVLGALGITAVGQKFLDANLAADKLQKSLNAVNGDAKKTESDLAFLKETAQRLGINLESSSNGFFKLAAAAKGTALEGQATRDIFTGIAGAMAQLGLSSVDTERAFVAIGQMMSKGTVNAEELKGQLGDVLPGALQMAARATGLTTQELGKLMETGGLLADDFLPRFAAEVQRSFGSATGEVQGLSNTVERVKNTWSQAFKIFGDTGALAALGGALGVVNEAFLILATGVTVVVSGFMAFVKAIAATTAAVLTLDFSVLKESLAEIGAELVDNTTKMASLTGTSRLLGEATNSTGAAMQKATDSANQAGAGWVKLVSAYDQATKSLADYAEQVKLTTKANDEQAAVLVKIAQLSGDENELLRAKENATRVAADGAEKNAQAINDEAKALQAKLIALQEEIKGQKEVSADKAKAIEEARKLAEAKSEEARAALVRAEAARVESAAAEVESAAHLDNSRNVALLRDAYEQAASKLTVLRDAQALGVDVSTQLNEAQLEAARATKLYNDALRDQAAMIVNANSLKQSQLSIEQAVIRLAIEQQRTAYEVARARGDEEAAGRSLMQMKRLEIQLAELTANAKQLEAQAAMAKVQADREELQSRGALSEAAALELQAREAAAGVKMKEAEIAGELARRMKELVSATISSGHAAGGSSGGFDKLAGSMNNAADAAGRLRAAQGGGGGNGTPNFSTDTRGTSPGIGSTGSTVDDPSFDHSSFLNGGHQANRSVSSLDALYKSGASVAEAKAATKYFGELFQRAVTAGSDQVRSTEDNIRLIATASSQAAEKAIELAKQELATGQAVDLGLSVSDIEQRNLAMLSNRNVAGPDAAFRLYREAVADAGRQAQAQPMKIDINLGGRQHSLNVASQADANALGNIFRLLEDHAQRAF